MLRTLPRAALCYKAQFLEQQREVRDSDSWESQNLRYCFTPFTLILGPYLLYYAARAMLTRRAAFSST